MNLTFCRKLELDMEDELPDGSLYTFKERHGVDLLKQWSTSLAKTTDDLSPLFLVP